MSLMAIENQPSVDMELGIIRPEDEDELFLKRLSVYATIRPGDLKKDMLRNRTDGHKSLTELFQGWDLRDQRDLSNEQGDIEDSLPEQLELRDHELPVKGFEIDSRIAPGFRYTVRYIGTPEYLFDGQARRLESIGLGYGRRLTFQGDKLNFNDCYFWSDSNPNGFAFNVEAVRSGDCFSVVDADSQVIGSVEVQNVDFPQIELDSVVEGKNVVKNVKVRFACFLRLFNTHNHSLVNVNTQEFEIVEGMAHLVKEKGNKEAVVKSILNVHFKSVGKCTLHCDP